MSLHHPTGVDGRGLADGHWHAQRMQAVERLVGRHAAVRGITDDRVDRAGNVGVLRCGRRLLEGAEVVLARELLVLLARQGENTVSTVLAAVGSLVSAEKETSQYKSSPRSTGFSWRGSCVCIV
jgi:hypothetical protein